MTCPYCDQPATLVDSAVIYGRSYGPIWLCSGYPECDVYVGTHKGATEPLGTMADADLRAMRKLVHAAFDPLWKEGHVGRKEAYRLLATEMGIPGEECHVAMFGPFRCGFALASIEKIKKDNGITYRSEIAA